MADSWGDLGLFEKAAVVGIGIAGLVLVCMILLLVCILGVSVPLICVPLGFNIYDHVKPKPPE